MQEIKIKCTSGITLPLSELSLYPNKLKKHSMLEIERLVDSISNDGFLFPLAVGKIKDKNYVIDGEATFIALNELSSRGYEIPAVPVFYVKSSEKTIKRNILISASTNHSVTETSLKSFAEDTEISLKNYGFSTSDLIDFHDDLDIGLYVDTIGGKYNEKKIDPKDFEGLLK